MKRGPAIALALGGGAARGWAHIGVLRVLEAEGITIGAVAGTSIGALVGAAFAAGRLDAVEMIARTAGFGTILSYLDPGLGGGGLLGGRRVLREMVRHLGRDTGFDTLPIPLSLIAADLMTGEEVRLGRGPLIPAIRASIAIPSLFAPVEIGGRYLVDGGMVAALPLAAAQAIAGDMPVVAIDLMDDYAGHVAAAMAGGKPRHALATGRASFLMLMRVQTRQALLIDPPAVLIAPRIGHISTGAFGAGAELIEAGRVAAIAAVPRIEAALVAQKSGNRGQLLNR